MNFLKFIFAVFISFSFLSVASAGEDGFKAGKIAFGFLSNKSDDPNYEYLETIFPNSFANSIQGIYKAEVLKPVQINEILKKKSLELKKDYEPYEAAELLENLDCDAFIYGSFVPMKNNTIRIVLSFYKKGSNRVFTFTNIGLMETEIFKLVDRITAVFVNFMSDETLYLSKKIAPGSRVGFVTNIDSEDLNALCSAFLSKGYRVSGIQANTVHGYLDEESIEHYKYITTRDNSFDLFTDRRKVKYYTGTWASEKYLESVKYSKQVYYLYDLNYLATKTDVISRLGAAYGSRIDALIIAGFDKKRKTAWVRCLDMNNIDLVWMQSGISGSSVEEIAFKMIEKMNSDLKLPAQIKQ